MKFGKKGQAEDFTDWIILVIGIVFLMIFLGLAILKPLEDKAQNSIDLFTNNGEVNDYLVQKRAEVQNGTLVTKEQLDREIYLIRSPPPDPVII
jgi:cytochrome c-type biogenesis protein CcmE